jgi:hypothetical protein
MDGVGVCVGVSVTVGVTVEVMDGVIVVVGVGVSPTVGVGVCVGDNVGVGVWVAVGVNGIFSSTANGLLLTYFQPFMLDAYPTFFHNSVVYLNTISESLAVAYHISPEYAATNFFLGTSILRLVAPSIKKNTSFPTL